MTSLAQHVAVFGATGAIGTALVDWFSARGWCVTAITRSERRITAGMTSGIDWIAWDPFSGSQEPIAQVRQPFDAIVWAQGGNINDNIYTFDEIVHEEIYRANVTYILSTLRTLLSQRLLAMPSRLCVISSIWQNIARQNKLSYTVSKSALKGLVQSLAIDLGAAGHLINAILPGALDTPMTHKNLNADQVKQLEEMTPIGTLPALADVCGLAEFLCSSGNTGITGQFIAADRGFSYARII